MVSYLSSDQLQNSPSTEVEQAFDSFDEELKLDPDERVKAERFHNSLSARLKADEIISDAFLQGSFARKTMLKPLRDIDKVVILNRQYAHLLSDKGGSVIAADLVETALRGYYPNAKFKRTRHSIQLDPGPNTISFDVVPAFEADDGTKDVVIVDLERGGWERSNTRELMSVVADRNKACDSAFVHQVRLIKHWSQRVLDDRLPGLHVESIAYACIDRALDHVNAVNEIFACGAQLLSSSSGYMDPTGVDELSARLAYADREATRQAFLSASISASKALSLDEDGQHEAALAAWFSIFDEPFPYIKPVGGDYLRGLGAGAAVSSGIATSVPRTTPTRAWSPQ